jgi:hypothetical protein
LNIQAVLESIKKGVQDIVDQVLASFKISKKITSLQSEDQIKLFIQQRSAYVTQTTLYGYLKTRIGTRYLSMFEDKVFSESIDIAKWNIYVTALADCTLYVYSYLVSKKGLKENSAEKIFNEIIEDEKKNGLNEKLANETKIEFAQRLREVNWQSYHAEDPFIKSGYALYRWSPIADELKVLDKEIVLNSIMLKWNLVKNEFLELTDKFENI